MSSKSVSAEDASNLEEESNRVDEEMQMMNEEKAGYKIRRRGTSTIKHEI